MKSIQRLRVAVASLGLVAMLGVGMAGSALAQSVGQAVGAGAVAGGSSGGSSLGGALGAGLSAAAPAPLKGANNLNTIIAGLISGIIGFLGVVLFLYLLWGGFTWMTAAGDAAKVKTATAIIRNAIIGLVIIAVSYAVATFIISTLSVATGGAPITPTQ